MTILRGHALRVEGKPFDELGCIRCSEYSAWTGEPVRRGFERDGHGLCECGATSEHVDTDAERQRWHRFHKEARR